MRKVNQTCGNLRCTDESEEIIEKNELKKFNMISEEGEGRFLKLNIIS